MPVSWVLIAAGAFVVMEPITAATHRWIMHGIGWVLHRSHHRRLATRVEANDAFPVVFSAVVCLAMAIGFNVDGWSVLIPITVGITLYGIAYGLVHDGYIHRRIRIFGGWHPRTLESLADAHALHHRFNDAPYGMLVPIVPARVRQRANGSAPSQVPVDA